MPALSYLKRTKWDAVPAMPIDSRQPEPFRSHISLYVRPNIEDRGCDAISRVGDTIRCHEQIERPSSGKPCSSTGKGTDMVKTLNHEFRIVRRPTAVIAVALLVGLCGQAWAGGASPLSASATQVAFLDSQGPTAGESVFTSRGPAFVTGHVGSWETTTLPGSGGQGLLMNNGNGTSTLIVPGGIPQTIATPR